MKYESTMLIIKFYLDVYGDECDCPIGAKQWKKALKCPKNFPQIDEDFKPHKTIDLSTLRSKMLQRFAKSHSICHYVVKSNKVWHCFVGSTFEVFVHICKAFFCIII